MYEWEKIKEHSSMPWCQDDPDKLGQSIVQLLVDQETFINRWAYKWYESLQFIYGNHNVKYSKRYGLAVDTDFLRTKSRTESRKRKTNITRVCAEALSSMIYANTPKWEAVAHDGNYSQSTRMASTVQGLLDAYVSILELDDLFSQAATGFVTYGQIAAEISHDYTQGRIIKVPKYQAGRLGQYRTGLAQEPLMNQVMDSVVPALDSNGEHASGDTFFPMTDETGSPEHEMIDMRLGSPQVEILTPFEYRREPGSSSVNTAKWIQRIRVLDYDDWVRRYGQLSGQTEHFHKIVPESMTRVMQAFAVRHYLRSFLVSPDSEDIKQSDIFTNYIRKKIVVIEQWDRPNEQWPEGRRTIVANGYCTHITTPQYNTNKTGGWHPFVEVQWMKAPPATIAISPLADVIEKNKDLNVTDSLIATAVLRNMGSKMMVKSGAGLDKDKITGTPGEIIEVADLDSVRYLHDSQPIPAVISTLRNEYKEDVYESSGAGDALRGQRTVGVSSGYAYRQAQEREEKRLAPARKRFEKFIGAIGEKLIACVKTNCIELGDDVVGYLKTHSGQKFSSQDIVNFLSSPIIFGAHISVTGSSMELKSKATKQANLQELARGPLGERLSSDAYVMDKYLKEFEADHLRDLSASHRDRAQRENEMFSDMLKLGPSAKMELAPVVFSRDDHDVHGALHTNWLIENDAELMQNPWLMELMILHLETHRMQKRELEGEAPPGASAVVPQMAKYASKEPNVAGVIAANQQIQQRKAEETAQAETQTRQQAPQNVTPTSGGRAPAGASSPAEMGSGGGRQTPAGTPAANTPAGRGQVGGDYA